MNNYNKICISIIFALLMLFIWMRLVELDKVFEHFKDINTVYILPSIFFYLLSYLFRSQRLYNLLKVDNKDNSLTIMKNYLYVLSANFLNYFIPLRAGEIGKIYFYKKNHNINWDKTIPIIFVDKVCDTFSLVLVLIMIPITGIVLSYRLKILLYMLIAVFLLCFSILILASISQKKVSIIFEKIIFFIPSKLKEKILVYISNFTNGIAVLLNKKEIILPTLFYTIIACINESFFFYLMFKTFSVNIEFAKVFFGNTLLFLSYILPHPPAQIGSNEVIMFLIFSVGFGLEENIAGAVMAYSHILTGIIIVITGLFSLFYSGINIFTHKFKE